MSSKNIFTVALKSIGFAWQTNRKLLIILILLNIFQGSIVYLQFTSFASIVDEIIRIKQGISGTDQLIRSSIILGLSFLVPTIVGNVTSYFRTKFRMQQSVQLELYK